LVSIKKLLYTGPVATSELPTITLLA